MSRVLASIGAGDPVITTTGFLSREAFASADRDATFYMLGSMGLASAFALGIAILKPHLHVFVLEGDGSALMSLGTLPLIAAEAPANLTHIIFDNGVYESTGGQPTIASTRSLSAIGAACGYRSAQEITEAAPLQRELARLRSLDGPHLIVAKVTLTPIGETPRVGHTPEHIRDRFMAALNPSA